MASGSASSSSYGGQASTVQRSDVMQNNRGVYMHTNDAMPLSKWPYGSRNNIFGNTTKQLYLDGEAPWVS
jgi:hypothetical protein